MFGLQQFSRRYSTPSSLRGTKLSLSDMNRTQSLKFRRISEIQSARAHLPDYDRQANYHLIGQANQPESNHLFFSHSKVLKRNSSNTSRSLSNNNNSLIIKPSRQEQRKEVETPADSQSSKKGKIYFYSSNLDQNMNLYMNRMLNRSQHERKEKMRQIEQTINITYLDKINTTRPQNQFWRKMKRSISKKERPESKQSNNRGSNKVMWEGLMRK